MGRMPSYEVIEQILRDALIEAGLASAVQPKKTMGSNAIHLKGILIAHITAQGLALRLSTEDQATLLKVPGASRFTPGNDTSRANQFVYVPDSILDARPHLAGWVKKCWKFVAQSHVGEPKRRR